MLYIVELGLGPLFKPFLHYTRLLVGRWVVVLQQCNNGPPRITAPVHFKAATTHPIHMTHKDRPTHKLRADPPNSPEPPSFPGFSILIINLIYMI